jgi:hypothetical protein
MADKKVYVKAVLLADLWKDDAAWQENVRSSGVVLGYTVASDEECDGEGGEEKEFAEDELTLTNKVLFDFMGSKDEKERFFPREEQIYAAADGTMWVEWHEELFDV